MRTNQGGKTIGQLIIGLLLSGKAVKAREVSEQITNEYGRKATIQEVSNTLAKISDSSRCDLGNFVKKFKEGGRYTFEFVDEAKSFTEEQAHGLSLKVGKNRYTLDQALADYPELGVYVAKRKTPKVAKVRKKEVPETENNQPLEASPSLSMEINAPDQSFVELVKRLSETGINININVSFRVDSR